MPSLAEQILEFSKQQTIINLIESGVDVNFIDFIIERLNSAVANGENLDDLIDELKDLMISTDTKKGLLQRYVSQVASDSITQFNANYTQALVQGTTIEFYFYDGTTIKGTRPFCSKHQQKYYHKEEVELLGMGKEINGVNLPPDQLKGRISGTNKNNIFINRGGWNCRHQFMPVSVYSVPKEVIIRNIKNGYYQPTEKQLERLGL